MKAEIDRLRPCDASELVPHVDTPSQISFRSRTGRQLRGEIRIFWNRFEDSGSIAVTVDVCEPRPGRVRPIAHASFIRFPDGRLTDPTWDPYEPRVIPGVPGWMFHDSRVTALHLDPATQTLQLDIEHGDWSAGPLSLRFEGVTDYELTELNNDGFWNIMDDLEVVVADDGRLEVELRSCYPGLGVEGSFRCASVVEA